MLTRLASAIALALCFACGPTAPECPEGQVCLVTECGNTEVDPGETCDDGNHVDGDGCSHDCQSTEQCGNGHADPAAGEACDDGNTAGGDGCSADCASNELCGNGVTDTAVGEVCDDGNRVSEDGCRSDCLSDETCGNGKLDSEIGEVCDDGNASGADGCASNCRSFGECGDGVTDIDETCDDGNTDTEAACAYGTNVCETCNASCSQKLSLTGNLCGDGVRADGIEGCDDAGNSDACDADCTPASCGDGYVNAASREECDTGGTPTAACDADCTIAYCGDGNFNAAGGEVCDTAGNSAGCDVDCTVPSCGDGLVNPSADEECEDGNTAEFDGCFQCRLERCGNGVQDSGEACDDGNRITENSCPYGTATCVACDASCSSLNLTGPVCGDGAVDGPEMCDDANPACGSCSADCRAVTESQATGTIGATNGSELLEGETFTISDGQMGITFEFDTDGLTTGANFPVLLAVSSLQVRDNIRTALNNSALSITATNGPGATVLLTNHYVGSHGNESIAETVTSPAFYVQGMSGGAGSDCPSGGACTADNDCATGLCDTGGGSGVGTCL